MQINPNIVFFIVSLLIVLGLVVYTLCEAMKKLRLRIMSLQLEIEKCRKAFNKQEKHKRRMLKEQREYLKIPLSKREKEYQ